MKLFIIDKEKVESEIGCDNLTLAHQTCYKRLNLNLAQDRIPLSLYSDFAVFKFVKYDFDTQMYFYRMEYAYGV